MNIGDRVQWSETDIHMEGERSQLDLLWQEEMVGIEGREHIPGQSSWCLAVLDQCRCQSWKASVNLCVSFFFWPVLLTYRSLLVCCWQDLWAGDRPSSDGAHLGQWSVARTAQPQAWSVQGKTHRTHPQTLTQLSVLHIKHRLVEFATAEGGSVEEERQDPGWTLGAHGSSLSPQHFSACALNCLFPRPMWCWILIAAHFLHIQHALTDKGNTGVSPGHARTLDIHSSPAHLPCNQWTSCFFSFVTYWLATQPYCGENYFSSPCFDIIAATLQCYSFLPVCLLLFISSIKRLQRVTISAGRL